MAKKKGQRTMFGLVCTVCKRQNYVSEKNKTNTTASLTFKKYCLKCRKHTEHKEKKKLD
jgi:large subunit ribosomal protein L33